MIMIWTTDTRTAKQHTCLAPTSIRLDSMDVTPLFPVFSSRRECRSILRACTGLFCLFLFLLYVLHLRPWEIVERGTSSLQVA